MGKWLAIPNHKARCLTCQHRFRRSEALRRLLTREATLNGAASAPDPLPAFFGVTDMDMPAVMPPLKPELPQLAARWMLSDVVETNAPMQYHLICPKCGMHLPAPQAAGECEGRSIAIIGEKGVGKSVFIGALIQQLVEGPLASRAGFRSIRKTPWITTTPRSCHPMISIIRGTAATCLRNQL